MVDQGRLPTEPSAQSSPDLRVSSVANDRPFGPGDLFPMWPDRAMPRHACRVVVARSFDVLPCSGYAIFFRK